MVASISSSSSSAVELGRFDLFQARYQEPGLYRQERPADRPRRRRGDAKARRSGRRRRRLQCARRRWRRQGHQERTEHRHDQLASQLNAQFDAARVNAPAGDGATSQDGAGATQHAHHHGHHAHAPASSDGSADSSASASAATTTPTPQDPMGELAHALHLLKAYADNSGSGSAAPASINVSA